MHFIIMSSQRNGDTLEVKLADFGLSALVRVGEDGYHGSKSSRRKLFTGLHEVRLLRTIAIV